MPLRDSISLGINHHLLHAEVASDPVGHRDTLLPILRDHRFEAVDLWIPDTPAIADTEIRACNDSGKLIIYNIGSRQGKRSPHPASPDPKTQAYSLDFYKRELDQALNVNAVKVVTNSGADLPGDREAAFEALVSFYTEICRYVPDNVTILVEPTDREVSKCKFIGPSREAATLCDRIHAEGCRNFASMVDMGHVPLMNETIAQAFADSREHVGHIHLGNCIVNDLKHPLFGDKHVPWGIPGGEYDTEDVAELLRCVKTNGYIERCRPATVSFEMRPYPELSPEASVDIFFKKLQQAEDDILNP